MIAAPVFSCCWPEVRCRGAVVGERPAGVAVARLGTDPTVPRWAAAAPRLPGADTAVRAWLELPERQPAARDAITARAIGAPPRRAAHS